MSLDYFLTQDSTTGQKKARSQIIKQEIPSGVIDGVNTDFILSLTPIHAESVFIYLNGRLQTQTGSGYSVNILTKTITFVTAPSAGQEVYATYIPEN